VIDAESTDGTVALAQAAGAEIVVRPWPGFVAARREALALVRSEWTLMLDADESLDPALRTAIEAAAADGVDGYLLRRVTFLCGRPVWGAGWGEERLLRLFRTGAVRLEARPAAGGSAELHERWVTDGLVEELGGTLLHDSYPTLASYREKFARYTSLEAAGLRAGAADVLRAFAVAVARFGWLLVVRGGWRDGWRGAYVSLFSALYPAVVVVKAARR
jgi:glycosyltransferase involved in cell wall biosynthesis